MKKLILVNLFIIGLLSLTSPVCAEIEANYIIQFQPNLYNYIYHMTVDPATVEAQTGYVVKDGDIWIDTLHNDTYLREDNAWRVLKKTTDIDAAITTFKSNLSQVTDPKAKACLTQLGKILLKLYKEE